MARRKRTSPVLEKAVRRMAGISSIDPYLDLGNGLSLSSFSSLIETMRTRENAYNAALSNLDRLYQEMLETERELGDVAERMLMGIGTRYGKGSVEYGMAGGTPKNQHRKTQRSNSTTSSTQPLSLTTRLESNGSKNGSQATPING